MSASSSSAVAAACVVVGQGARASVESPLAGRTCRESRTIREACVSDVVVVVRSVGNVHAPFQPCVVQGCLDAKKWLWSCKEGEHPHRRSRYLSSLRHRWRRESLRRITTGIVSSRQLRRAVDAKPGESDVVNAVRQVPQVHLEVVRLHVA